MKNLRLSHSTSLWFDITLENSTHNHLIRTERLKRAGICASLPNRFSALLLFEIYHLSIDLTLGLNGLTETYPAADS